MSNLSLSVFLCLFGFAIAHPMVKGIQIVEVEITKRDQTVETKQAQETTQTRDKLRQDGDGDGDATGLLGGIEGVGEIGSLGEQVGTIISGVLGGNFETILKGAVSFIPEEDTQLGVGTILNSVGKPLNLGLMSGIKAAQSFFGITEKPAVLAATSPGSVPGVQASGVGQVVPGAVPATGTVQTVGAQQAQAVGAQQAQAVGAQQAQYVTAAPVAVVQTTTEEEEDDDDESDSRKTF